MGNQVFKAVLRPLLGWRVSRSMDPAALVEQCRPGLERRGLLKAEASVADAQARSLQGLWTGEGGIIEVHAKTEDGGSCSFIAKKIGSYKNALGDELTLMDQLSYYNEMQFYEQDFADRMCAAGAVCPLPVMVIRSTSSTQSESKQVGEETSGKMERRLQRFGVKRARLEAQEEEVAEEERDEGIICMTQLAGGRWSPSKEKARAALVWLARLHALFWGKCSEEAVATGVSDTAGFWHLDNRHIEFARMSARSPLRLAARALDARLKADRMQTMCHGDPKGANIMWDEAAGTVSMYDFQWFGQAPPGRDLAYFMATAAMNRGRWDQTEEAELIRFHHEELCKLLAAQGEECPDFEHFWDSYRLCVCDYGRWMEGGFAWGNQALIKGHVAAVLKELEEEGGQPRTEEEFRERLFKRFPP